MILICRKELRHATTKKFIADKITEADRDEQIRRIDEKIAGLMSEKVEMDQYVNEKEQVVDEAMEFITSPDTFWNRASTKSRQAIQGLLFKSGIPYDFETGFGTHDEIQSYLLIKKIALESAKNSDLVAATRLELVTPGL